VDSIAELGPLQSIGVSVAAGHTRVCGMADSGHRSHVKLGSAMLHASIGERSASDIQLVCEIRYGFSLGSATRIKGAKSWVELKLFGPDVVNGDSVIYVERDVDIPPVSR
jgi:hypothetical protein